MARIWSVQEPTPAACITYAGSNSNNQPILFTTRYGDFGTWVSGKERPANIDPKVWEDQLNKEADIVELKWTIKYIDITLLRDWSTSQAMIILTCPLPNLGESIPPLPDLQSFRGGNYSSLTCEDEIRIYQGYVESLQTPITADLLDEFPFSFKTSKGKLVSCNPAKPLVPVFWGFIDKVEFSGNSKGLQITISCRDRSRIFADTRIISIPSFQGNRDILDKNDGSVKGDRADILMALANAATGNILGEGDGSCSCWKPINKGLTVRGYSQSNSNDLVVPQDDPTAWTREAALSLMANKAEPRFHIWTERPPIIKGNANATLQILDKTPLEIVDLLAKMEERPTDFYASHVNGDFIFGPRSLDMSGFEDELRSYRTYFFMGWPKKLNNSPPSPTQMIQSIRSVTTTLSTFNKFVVIDSSVSGGSSALLQNLELGVYSLSWGLSNRTVSPPCRTQIIKDGSLSTYPNKDQGALIVALSQARQWSRDIGGIQIEIAGDPTFFPGEAIRIYNTGLHDNQTYSIIDNTQAEGFYYEMKKEAEKVAEQTKSETKDQKSKACASDVGSKFVSKFLTQNPSRLPTDIQGLILPIYKVRAIKHTLKADGKRGYTSTIQGSMDF